MRSLIRLFGGWLLIVALLFGAWLAKEQARAQNMLPLMGAGGNRTAGFVPCAGTVIHLSQPNDLTVTWSNSGTATAVANATSAPDSTLTASSGTSVGANFLGGFAIPTITLAGSTTYSLTGYAQASVSPNWLYIGYTDFGTYRTSNYFDIGNGVPGSADSGVGDGTVTCAKISPSTGAWFEYSLGVSFGSTHTGNSFLLDFAGGNSNATSTNGQKFFSWGVGQ